MKTPATALAFTVLLGAAACTAPSPPTVPGSAPASPLTSPAASTLAGRSEAQPSPPSAAPSRPTAPGRTPAATADPEFEVELRRQGCFGRCPSYRVSLSADGTVRFVGERYVASPGEHKGQVPASVVAALRADLQREPFVSLDGRYTPSDPRCGSAATDMASVSIAIRDGGFRRDIEHYLGCSTAPGSLRDLAAAIDTASGSARWINAPTE